MRRRLVHLLLGIFMLVAVQPARSQTSPSGTPMLPEDAVGQLSLVGAERSIAQSELVDIAQMPFTRAVRATTTAGPRTEWGVQLNLPVSVAVQKGDVVLAKFAF